MESLAGLCLHPRLGRGAAPRLCGCPGHQELKVPVENPMGKIKGKKALDLCSNSSLQNAPGRAVGSRMEGLAPAVLPRPGSPNPLCTTGLAPPGPKSCVAPEHGSRAQMKGKRLCVCVCVERVYKSVPRSGNLLRLLDLREVAFLLYSQITRL